MAVGNTSFVDWAILTHLQDAVPIRLGQEFEAYSRVIERDIQRIKQSQHHLYEVNMGATAVGTGLNADPRYIQSVVEHLSDISGYQLKGADHLVDATQNTDAYTEVSAALKVGMMNMSKISRISASPALGPDAIKRKSLAILDMFIMPTFKAADTSV